MCFMGYRQTRKIILFFILTIFCLFFSVFSVEPGFAEHVPTGKIIILKGDVIVKKKGADGWTAAKANMELADGDQVKTGAPFTKAATNKLFRKYPAVTTASTAKTIPPSFMFFLVKILAFKFGFFLLSIRGLYRRFEAR